MAKHIETSIEREARKRAAKAPKKSAKRVAPKNYSMTLDNECLSIQGDTVYTVVYNSQDRSAENRAILSERGKSVPPTGKKPVIPYMTPEQKIAREKLKQYTNSVDTSRINASNKSVMRKPFYPTEKFKDIPNSNNRYRRY